MIYGLRLNSWRPSTCLLPASTLRAKPSSDGVYAWGRRLARLCLATLVSKMRVRTVGNQGLILRGTFREHFTFHIGRPRWAARRLFERAAGSQTRLAP